MKKDKEFENLLPPPRADEKRKLEQSILTEGCCEPVILWQGLLIDGYTRLEICERHGVEYMTKNIELPNRDAVKIWMIDNQDARRNWTDGWRFELIQVKRELLTERGRGKQGERTDLLSENDKKLNEPKHDTRKSVAEELGWSTGKVAAADKVWKDANPEVKEQVKSGELSIHKAYRQIKQKEKNAAKLLQMGSEIKHATIKPTVERADCKEWLSIQLKCDLLLTDPPYSTDIEDIEKFAQDWLPYALSRVKPTGRAFVFVGAYPQELQAYMNTAMPNQILVWTYRNTLGPSPSMDYKTNWQAILYYRMPDAEPLNCPQMTEQFSVQDINAPDGRQGDRFHEWQKPDEIAERLIRHATNSGDLVLDPFCCTGCFPIAASKLGRAGRGCDNDNDVLKIAVEKRGCKWAMNGKKT